MKNKIICFLFILSISYSIYSENVMKMYFDTIPDFCSNNYEKFETLLNKEQNLKDAKDYGFSKSNLIGIKRATIKDKYGEYSITYRINTETNKNEIVYGYFLDANANTYKNHKEIYDNTKEFYDYLLKQFGEPKISNDLGFIKYNENQKNHSINAQWIIDDYKIRFFFKCAIFSEYNYLNGPFITIESKNLNKDLQSLIKVNLHQKSTYYYPYHETRNDEDDFLIIIDLDYKSVYDFDTLALLKGDVSSTDSTIELKFNTGVYIFTYIINRYTAKYTQTTYIIETQELFEKSTGDVIIIDDKPKF